MSCVKLLASAQAVEQSYKNYTFNPFKNLLWNWRADFPETWYVALGTPAHHNLFK